MSLEERVKKAFTGAITANDSALTQDQIRAIQIVCANIDFAKAVGNELIRLGIVKPQKEPTSPDKQRT